MPWYVKGLCCLVMLCISLRKRQTDWPTTSSWFHWHFQVYWFKNSFSIRPQREDTHHREVTNVSAGKHATAHAQGQITHMTAGTQFLFTNSWCLTWHTVTMRWTSTSPFSSMRAAFICVSIQWILSLHNCEPDGSSSSKTSELSQLWSPRL